MKVIIKLRASGAAAAGFLIHALSSGRWLVAQRSRLVHWGGMWSGVAGHVEIGETPLEAAFRELQEELGFNQPHLVVSVGLVKVSRYFHQYLLVVSDEFVPTLNWENSAAVWCQWSNFPQPMHPALKALLANPAVLRQLRALL